MSCGVYTYIGLTDLTLNFLYAEASMYGEYSRLLLSLIWPLDVLLHSGFLLEIFGTMLLFSWIIERLGTNIVGVTIIWLEYIVFVYNKIYAVIKEIVPKLYQK